MNLSSNNYTKVKYTSCKYSQYGNCFEFMCKNLLNKLYLIYCSMISFSPKILLNNLLDIKYEGFIDLLVHTLK